MRSKSGWMERRRILSIVKNESHKTKKVREVIEFVKQSGGIEYAKAVMNRYHQEAIALLKDFPESSYKKSLEQLVQFTIDRNN